MTINQQRTSRRRFLQAAGGFALTASPLGAPFVIAQPAPIKVGLMLPYTGTYASLGNAITNAFKLYVAEKGGKLAGREVEYVVLDDESEPAKAVDNANRIVNRDKVDVLVGTVHSGVQAGMVKVSRESGVLSIIPNAGFGAATGALCAPNIFRTSFSNWQTIHALGKVMWEKGHKSAAWITHKYAAGEEMFGGFKEGYEKVGGRIVKDLWLPFPNVEFQALLTEIAAAKPDAVAAQAAQLAGVTRVLTIENAANEHALAADQRRRRQGRQLDRPKRPLSNLESG